MKTEIASHVSMATLALVGVWLTAGCSVSYRTPGGGMDFAILAEADVEEIFSRQPMAKYPARVAVVRVQAPHYRSKTTRGYGTGRFSVVTVRDIETEAQFERIESLPGVAGLAPLSRLLLGAHLESDRPLRRAAASLHADMLLIYTLDTNFFVSDALKPVTVLTLGLSPNQQVRVTTTASAMLARCPVGLRVRRLRVDVASSAARQ